MKLDFSKLQQKYSLLEGVDISLLNNYFNQKDILEILEEVEKNRKNLISTITISNIIFTLVSIYLKYFSGLNETLVAIVSIFLIGNISVFVLSRYIFSGKKTIKGDILPNLAKKIDKKMSYSEFGELYKESMFELVGFGLMDSYDRVDLEEDSIKFSIGSKGDTENTTENITENKLEIPIIGDEIGASKTQIEEEIIEDNSNIEIMGKEIKTSKLKVVINSNGGSRTQYVTNNHLYILKAKFNNPRYKIKKSIYLSQDVMNSFYRKHITVVAILCVIAYIFLKFSGLVLLKNLAQSLYSNIGIIYGNIFMFILVALLYYIVYTLFCIFSQKERVELENIDFEKKFDVHSKDSVEARKILTPSFMYRILDYVNKIDPKRVYEFYFIEDTFYIKYDLLKSGKSTYMEFSLFKNTFKNLTDFIEFYLEMKNIKGLVKDLKLFYYDKGTYDKEIIK